MRKITFTNGEFYHIYSRGVDKRKIFMRAGHYGRFIKTLSHLLNYGTAQLDVITRKSLAFSKKLSFICYCLMPNHFHFILCQLDDHAISNFMHGLGTSYTKYFNLDRKRTGRLFEYTFRAVHVEDEAQFIHLSRYIHLNPLISGITDDLKNYQWSSYPDYIGIRDDDLCRREEILSLFPDDSYKSYEKFILDQVDYARKLEEIKKHLLD